MNFKCMTRSLTYLLLASTALPVVAADGVLLAPSARDGRADFIEWAREGEVEMTESPLGPARSSPTRLIRTFKRTIDATGDTVVTLTFDRLAMTAGGMRGVLSYDSDGPADRQPAPLKLIADETIGRSVKLTLDEQGNVKACKGMDDISLAVEEKVAGKFVFEPYIPDFTNDAVRFDLGQERYALYPNRKVEPGDTWTATVMAHDLSLGTVKYTYRCRLESVDDGTARVTFDGDVEAVDGRPGIRVFNISRKLEKATFTGEAVFDVKAGEFTRMEKKTEMTVDAMMLLGSRDDPPHFNEITRTTTTVRILTGDQRGTEKEEHHAEVIAAAEAAAAQQAAEQAEEKPSSDQEPPSDEETPSDDGEE